MCCIPWDEVNAFEIMKLLIDAGANPSDHDFQVTKVNYRMHIIITIRILLVVGLSTTSLFQRLQ